MPVDMIRHRDGVVGTPAPVHALVSPPVINRIKPANFAYEVMDKVQVLWIGAGTETNKSDWFDLVPDYHYYLP